MNHTEWYNFYKLQRSQGKAHNAAAIAKKFGVSKSSVASAVKNEEWGEKYDRDLQEERSKKQAANRHLEDLELFRKSGISTASLSSIATDGAKLVKRFQAILDRRISTIEMLGADTSDDELFESFIYSTSQMLSQQAGALQRVISTIQKTRAIVAEALDVQETILIVKQLELDLE
jgi:hypothetical protein